jgi:serine phosphatase RsbU (regulator of sigma subunit)/putative methionine-R-sulfoxide reductase with GAF domain
MSHFVPTPVELRHIEAELLGLYAELDLHSLLTRMADKIRLHLHCQEASIFLYHARKEQLFFEVATGEKGGVLKQIVLQKGEGIAGWIAQHSRPLIINDCQQDPRFSARTDHQTSFVTRSIIGVPVVYDGKLLGVLEGINQADGFFRDGDETALSLIARLTAIPLQNALLFRHLSQETREKDTLLALAREIAVAGRMEEIFPSLVDLVTGQAHAEGIILELPDEAGAIHKHTLLGFAEDTAGNLALFPFSSRKGSKGSLGIRCRHPLAEESVRLFHGLASFLAILLSKLEMLEDRIRQEKMERELEIARAIQQSFLLASPPMLPGIEASFINIPSSRMGGDYYDLIPLPDGQLVVGINDIAGHGIPASLLMAIFRSHFCYHTRRGQALSETIGQINEIIAQTTDPGHYLTSFSACINRADKSMQYLNAGHPAPLLIRGERVIPLDGHNLVVGMFPGLAFRVEELALQTGDLLCLFTDGVPETLGPDDEEFGMVRLTDTILACRHLPLDEVRDRLLTDLRAFHGPTPFEDDVTVLLLRLVKD